MDELLQPIMCPGDVASIRQHLKVAANLTPILLSHEREIELAFRAQPDELRTPYTLHWTISLKGDATGAHLELQAIGNRHNQDFLVECRRVVMRLLLHHCRNLASLTLCAGIRDLEYIRADPDDESQQTAAENRRQDFEGMFYSVCNMEEFVRHYQLLQSLNVLTPLRKLSLQGVSFLEEFSANLGHLTHLDVQLANAFDDTVIHGLLEHSQSLQELRIVCQEGFLWDASIELEHDLDIMMINLPQDNPQLRKIHVEGTTIKFRYPTKDGCNAVVEALRGLPELEEFHIRAPRLGQEFADALVRALPQTAIRRFILDGIPLPSSSSPSSSYEGQDGCFDTLYNYLSQPQCPIEFMKLDISEWDKCQTTKWFDLLVAGTGISVTRHSLQPSNQAITYLWHMKMCHPLWTELADNTQLGLVPHILKAVQRQEHQGTWFEQSSEQGASTDQTARSRHASSMVYALLREQAYLLCNNTQGYSITPTDSSSGSGRGSWRLRTKKKQKAT